MKITAAIITFNEAENIRDACQSVAWVDEIVVVDSESSDATRDIAASCGARVINRGWPGFALQKQFATDQAANDWVLSLDADERVSPELKTSILKLVDQDPGHLADGYLIPRRSFYMGRWIRGGGWYPDKQLRLFRKVWQPGKVYTLRIGEDEPGREGRTAHQTPPALWPAMLPIIIV
jgi:glycosyltransferase involved in cell wall biosynthesis